ncbi:DUF2306 domain-containing protein [Methylorubrum extorquens]|uniref:DUF2306 domain-containing protein n=1 Tax=Methylorubrum extorquens TaxID=408 RepID=UPI002238978A|nr:hypothetical protein [Methylorubrum extorquens]UYW31971.1 hypothetical protein OKB92_23880 [Methylorubrum extorquens]
MAEAAEPIRHGVQPRSLSPTTFERVLAYGSIILLVAVLVAVVRGHSDWTKVPVLTWLHIGTVGLSLALTPMLLLGRRGVRRHRFLGYLWVASMSATALLSFGIRGNSQGGPSAIHILSAITLTQAPMLAWHAHLHRVNAHRYTALSLVAGALIIAGFFTFPFGRMLGRWLLA